MVRPHRIYRGNQPDLRRRLKMRRLLEDGHSIEQVAADLQYANVQSAKVMAHRWGLNTLRLESYIARGYGRTFVSQEYRQSK